MSTDTTDAQFKRWEIDSCARLRGVGTLMAEYILKRESTERALDGR